jgi:hypothetical protein
MIVTGQDPTGQRRRWRVGRRRLAWVPRSPKFVDLLWGPDVADDPISGIIAALAAVVLVVPMLWYLGSWLVVLVAAPATWGWRAATGRWPVVAYQVSPGGSDRRYLVRAQEPAAAEALVARWAGEIREYGEPRHGLPTPAVASGA